jgi:uncharacterized membrane protein YdjX (TVP38/TMEM64 family)
MTALIRVALILFTLFASTFLLLNLTGILTVELIEQWLTQAKELSPTYMGLFVISLLFLDLFVAVPTLTVAILAGYFLGHSYGFIAVLIGFSMAGIGGYCLSRWYGGKLLTVLIKDEQKRDEAITMFQKHGLVTIILSRAMPILPEVSACLAGMMKLRFRTFLSAWLVSTVPYAFIATYAGSISSIDNPKPAIFIAIGLSGLLWACWFFYHRAHTRRPISKTAK